MVQPPEQVTLTTMNTTFFENISVTQVTSRPRVGIAPINDEKRTKWVA
jgi:hypothetical protein